MFILPNRWFLFVRVIHTTYFIFFFAAYTTRSIAAPIAICATLYLISVFISFDFVCVNPNAIVASKRLFIIFILTSIPACKKSYFPHVLCFLSSKFCFFTLLAFVSIQILPNRLFPFVRVIKKTAAPVSRCGSFLFLPRFLFKFKIFILIFFRYLLQYIRNTLPFTIHLF